MSKTTKPEKPEAGLRILDESTVEVTLNNPLLYGGEENYTFAVRKPMGLDLAGTNMTDVMQQNVTTLSRLLPKISTPVILSKSISTMDMQDIQLIGVAVSIFFTSAKTREKMAEELSEALG